jgi:hypothetical protein
MLFQAYTHELPTLAYYLALLLYVVALATSIAFGSEPLAVVGVFSIFLTIRLMFYVATAFLVFPFGDPYGQFGVLRAFDQSSHISILFPKIPPFDQTHYLAVVTNSYSQWPGFQILTLSLSRITGLGLLESAMAITMALDVGWFMVSYTLVRKILARMKVNLPNSAALCLAIVTALPTTEMPSFFKYDFPATLFLLVSVLLLLRIHDDHDLKVMLPLTILSAAITVTHSITSLFLVLLLIPFAIWATAPRLVKTLFLKLPVFVRRSVEWPSFNSHLPLYALLAFSLIGFFSWSAFYAVFLVKYWAVSTGKILSSFSLGALSFSHLSPGQSGSVLTPTWILDLLHVRNYVLAGLLLTGGVAVVLIPTLVRKAHVKVLIFSVALITTVTEVSGAFSFGDRAFLLFAPLLGVLYLAGLIFVGSLRPRLAMVGAIFLMALLMFTAGIGFWASSYAPTTLYSEGADPSSASGRPLTWQAGASYFPFSDNPNCVLTNEIYTTSLSIPVEEWNITKLIGSVPPKPGCLVIVYSGLFSAANLNVSSFGFGEPYVPYSGFSPATFYGHLYNNTDRIFSTGEETFYYYS